MGFAVFPFSFHFGHNGRGCACGVDVAGAFRFPVHLLVLYNPFHFLHLGEIEPL